MAYILYKYYWGSLDTEQQQDVVGVYTDKDMAYAALSNLRASMDSWDRAQGIKFSVEEMKINTYTG